MDVIVWWMILITLVTNCAMFGGYIYSVSRIEKVATNTLFTMLKSKENRRELIRLFMNKETTNLVAEELFSRLKASIHGLIGVDKKAEKKLLSMAQEELTDATLQESGLGGLLQFLPTKMRKTLEENPTMLAAAIRVFGPMLAQRFGLGGGDNYNNQYGQYP